MDPESDLRAAHA
jgi:hypothetical protein